MQIFAVRSGKVREKLPQKVRESLGISSQHVGGNPAIENKYMGLSGDVKVFLGVMSRKWPRENYHASMVWNLQFSLPFFLQTRWVPSGAGWVIFSLLQKQQYHYHTKGNTSNQGWFYAANWQRLKMDKIGILPTRWVKVYLNKNCPAFIHFALFHTI